MTERKLVAYDHSTFVPPPKVRSGIHIPSMIAGFILGCLAAGVWVSLLPLLGDGSATLQVRPALAAGGETPVTADVGRGYQLRSYAHFPVSVVNTTGRDLRFITVRCAFYSKDGQLVATGYEGWPNVRAGQMQAGEVRTLAASIREIARYKCDVEIK